MGDAPTDSAPTENTGEETAIKQEGGVEQPAEEATHEADDGRSRRQKKVVEVVEEPVPEPEIVIEPEVVVERPVVIQQMKIFNDRHARNTLNVYSPCKQTVSALTEIDREIAAENMHFISVEDQREQKRLRLKAIEMEVTRQIMKEIAVQQIKADSSKVEATEAEAEAAVKAPEGVPQEGEDFSEKEEEILFADDLKTICIQKYATMYKRGRLDHRIQHDDVVAFGENLDIELPVVDIVKLRNDVYWRRVVEVKHSDQFELFKNCTEKFKNIENDSNLNWRQMGIEDKFAELIENQDPIEFDPIEFGKIITAVKPYIKRLNIKQLIPIPGPKTEHNKYNRDYKLYQIPIRDCHHIPLDVIIGELYNLTSLKLCISYKNVQRGYDSRYFEFSFDDITRLSNGLKKLEKLEDLKLYHSRMDDKKLKILLKNIVNLPIRSLDLSYCGLGNDGGKSIGYFLAQNETLKMLELQDNEFGATGCEAIAYGLQNFRGEMVYFGIARNPIMEAGIMSIGAALVGRNHITEMNFSGCEVDGTGAYRLIQIMAFHEPLLKFDMSCIQLDSGCLKKLMVVLEYNHKLIEFNCNSCKGINEVDMIKIKDFIKRNNTYLEFPEWDIYQNDPTTIGWKYRLHHIFKEDIGNSLSEANIVKYQQKIPECIPKMGRREYTTSKLLGRKYYYCSAPDRMLPAAKRKLFLQAFEKNKFNMAKRMCTLIEKRKRVVYYCKRKIKIRKLGRDRTYSKISKRYFTACKKAVRIKYREFHFKDNATLEAIGLASIGSKITYPTLQYFPSL